MPCLQPAMTPCVFCKLQHDSTQPFAVKLLVVLCRTLCKDLPSQREYDDAQRVVVQASLVLVSFWTEVANNKLQVRHQHCYSLSGCFFGRFLMMGRQGGISYKDVEV